MAEMYSALRKGRRRAVCLDEERQEQTPLVTCILCDSVKCDKLPRETIKAMQASSLILDWNQTVVIDTDEIQVVATCSLVGGRHNTCLPPWSIPEPAP
jgi:hypothetical protein